MAAKIGDERFGVEWISKLPVDENGDADWDRATHETRHFDNQKDTLNLAHHLAKLCAEGKFDEIPVGSIMVTYQRAQLSMDFWEHERLRRIEWVDVSRCEIASPLDELELEPV